MKYCTYWVEILYLLPTLTSIYTYVLSVEALSEFQIFPWHTLRLVTFFCIQGGGKKKASASRRAAVETGTGKDDDVDYEWIPKSALRTPGSGKTSPRQRKGNRSAGSDTD